MLCHEQSAETPICGAGAVFRDTDHGAIKASACRIV